MIVKIKKNITIEEINDAFDVLVDKYSILINQVPYLHTLAVVEDNLNDWAYDIVNYHQAISEEDLVELFKKEFSEIFEIKKGE